jgi:Beta-propeller repeat
MNRYINQSCPRAARLPIVRASMLLAIASPMFETTARGQNVVEIARYQTGSSAFDSLGDIDRNPGGLWGVAGSTRGNLGGPNAGGSDWLAIRLGPGLTPDWIQQVGTPQDDDATGVVIDDTGGLFVAGQTWGDLAGPGTNKGGADITITYFDTNGNQIWTNQIGSAGDEYVMDACSDGQGGIYVCGYTNGDLFGLSAGVNDVFVCRADRDGTILFGTQFGTPENEFGVAVERDGIAGVFVAGDTDGDLGGPNLGAPDPFLARLDNQGVRTWTSQFGTPEFEFGNAVTPDGSGGAWVGGITEGNLGGPHQGFGDIYVVHIDSGAQVTVTYQKGTPSKDEVTGLAPNGAGGVFVIGATNGSLCGPNQGERDMFAVDLSAFGFQKASFQEGTTLDDAPKRAFSTDLEAPFALSIAGSTTGDFAAPNAGLQDAFVIVYERPPAACYPDCDQSTGTGVLDIFDFLCFQNSFVNSQTYACDCDTSTGPLVCDIFDFLCFQNAFVAGCP